jgi:hypothetical protein
MDAKTILKHYENSAYKKIKFRRVGDKLPAGTRLLFEDMCEMAREHSDFPEEAIKKAVDMARNHDGQLNEQLNHFEELLDLMYSTRYTDK